LLAHKLCIWDFCYFKVTTVWNIFENKIENIVSSMSFYYHPQRTFSIPRMLNKFRFFKVVVFKRTRYWNYFNHLFWNNVNKSITLCRKTFWHFFHLRSSIVSIKNDRTSSIYILLSVFFNVVNLISRVKKIKWEIKNKHPFVPIMIKLKSW
jgi:hypothetical protein